MRQEIIEINSRALHKKGLRLVSGKWFLKSNEITHINKYIGTACDTLELTAINKILDGVIILQGDTDGIWPEIEYPEIHGKLPFPLDEKQLVIINRMLYHRFDNKDRNIFITTGVGGSGKSTFLNIIKQIHKGDCANSSLSDLSNKFILSEAITHRLICSDELSCGELDLPALKILASKQNITANPKGKTPFEARTQSNLFWCCNKAPRLDVSDTGILRRIVYYERNTKIENPDESLQQRVYNPEELAIIATEAKKYDCNDWFERYFQDDTHKYLMESNTVWLCWTDDYTLYKNKCSEKGYRPFAEEKWHEIHDLFAGWTSKEPLKSDEIVEW